MSDDDPEQLRARLAAITLERDAFAKVAAIGGQLASQHDIEALAQQVTAIASEVSGAAFGAWYGHTDEHGKRFPLLAWAGVPHEVALRFPMPYRSTVFDGKQVVRLDDITSEHVTARGTGPLVPLDSDLFLRSYLAVPVLSRTGAVLGALMLGHREVGVFTPAIERIVGGLVAYAGTGIDNAQLHGDAQRLLVQLERSHKEIDQFTYAASHDLRAPLRGITNLATWIEEDLGATAPTKVSEQLQLLKQRAARMDSLIGALLELARVGRVRQQPVRVDLTELVHETIDLLGPEHPARVLIVGAMPVLTAERVALQQVLLNLISNALRHSGRADVEVRVTANETPEEIEIAVTDNGVGIPAEHSERVWQVFQTLTRETFDHTGTGLAIVQKHVEAAGGRAWVESPGTTPGATVRFTWPRRPRPLA